MCLWSLFGGSQEAAPTTGYFWMILGVLGSRKRITFAEAEGLY